MNCYAPPAVVGYLTHASWVSNSCREFLGDRTLSGVFGMNWREYGLALFLTILIEAPFYYWALRKRMGLAPMILYMVALNLATHPLVLMALPQFLALAEQPKVTAIVVGEIFAPLFEGLMLWGMARLPARQAFGFALLANLVSWTAGVLL